MGEGSAEISHRDKIKIIRKNLAERKNKKQIGLIQEALRRNSNQNEQTNKQPENQVKNTELVQSALYKALSEIAQQNLSKSFIIDEAAKHINSAVGPLLSEELRLADLIIPENSVLRVLQGTYDDLSAIQNLINHHAAKKRLQSKLACLFSAVRCRSTYNRRFG